MTRFSPSFSIYIKLYFKCYLNFDWQEKDGVKDVSVPGAGVIYHFPIYVKFNNETSFCYIVYLQVYETKKYSHIWIKLHLKLLPLFCWQFNFRGIISSCFEPHLTVYIELEEKTLMENLEKLVQVISSALSVFCNSYPYKCLTVLWLCWSSANQNCFMTGRNMGHWGRKSEQCFIK